MEKMLNGNQIAPETGKEPLTFDYHSENEYFRDQLAMMKESLLNPAEVTFKIQEQNGSGKILKKSSSELSDIGSVSSTSTNKEKRKIPDGGYGWVVVFASLMISFIADGISFSFGLLYTELLNYFKASPTKTAWVGSLFLAVPLLSGPLMSNLVDRFGCRKMTMLGGVVGCFGFALSSVSNSIEVLLITFGIISGLGLGVIYVTAVVSIAFWFESKRSFAIGIGASGTGIGTFVYAPLTQWLISYYGWRGATLILGGTLFNFSVFGALMIDPDWLIEENKLESRSQSMQTISNSSVALDEIKKLIGTGAPNEDLLDTLVTNLNTEANQQINPLPRRTFQSEILLPTFISNNASEVDWQSGTKGSSRRSLRPYYEEDEHLDGVGQKNEENLREKLSISLSNDVLELPVYQNISDINLEHQQDVMTIQRSGVHGSRLSFNEKILIKPSLLDSFKDKEKRRNTFDLSHKLPPSNRQKTFVPSKLATDNPYQPTTISKNVIRSRNPVKKQVHLNPVGNLKNIQSLKYSNYLKNIKSHRHSVQHRGHALSHPKYAQKASSCPNIYGNAVVMDIKEDEEAWYDDCFDMIKSIFDFSLFWEYKFGMMSLSTIFLYAWCIIPYFYIPEFVQQNGYTEEHSAYLISAIGIFNTIGMISLGWVADQAWCNVTKTYGLCMFLMGLSMALMPLAINSYVLLMFLCAVFGVTYGSSFSFTPNITSRLVDMDDFTLAYGLILLVQGIGQLVGPPLAGVIYDFTNRWDDSFYIGGVFVCLSGYLGYIIGSLPQHADDDEENK